MLAKNTKAQRTALPDELTRLYFRLVLPLVAVTALWVVYVSQPHDYRVVAPFSAVLLLVGWLYGRVPLRWQWFLRLGLAVFHVVMLAFMALLAGSSGWTVSADVYLYGTNALLLLAPITVLSWNFLFYDHPNVGRLLSLLLAGFVTALAAQWLGQKPGGLSLALMLLVSCLLVAQFGWNVTKLQRQAFLDEKDARHDALTGLRNRRAFDEVQELALLPGRLAVLDIDHFKAVNDTFGHPAGDRVLRAVGDVLLDNLPTGASAYRWGGEEFVLLLPTVNETEALELLENVRREVALRSFVGGTHVTLSAGLSTYGKERNLLDAFAQADTALLDAKRAGRDRIHVAGRAGSLTLLPAARAAS